MHFSQPPKYVCITLTNVNAETNPQLVKPERVDEEDNVKNEVAKDGHDHQWLPGRISSSMFKSRFP